MNFNNQALDLQSEIDACKTFADVKKCQEKFIKMKHELKTKKRAEPSEMTLEARLEEIKTSLDRKQQQIQDQFDAHVKHQDMRLDALKSTLNHPGTTGDKLAGLSKRFEETKRNIASIHGLSEEQNDSFTKKVEAIGDIIQSKEKEYRDYLARKGELTDVLKNIAALEKKLPRFDKLPEKTVYDVTNTLCQAIRKNSELYANNKMTIDQFRTTSLSAIGVARGIDLETGVLSKHRGCKEILLNLAFAIVTLGIGYVAAALIRKSFLPFTVDTDSRKKLQSIDEQLTALTAPPKPN